MIRSGAGFLFPSCSAFYSLITGIVSGSGRGCLLQDETAPHRLRSRHMEKKITIQKRNLAKFGISESHIGPKRNRGLALLNTRSRA